jgi:hypothetical protein
MQMNMSPANKGPVPVSAVVPISDRDAWCRAVAVDRHLSPRDRLIALCLSLSDTDQTYDQIGKSAGCGRRTAMRAVANLIERRWIVVTISSTGRVANSFAMQMRQVGAK